MMKLKNKKALYGVALAATLTTGLSFAKTINVSADTGATDTAKVISQKQGEIAKKANKVNSLVDKQKDLDKQTKDLNKQIKETKDKITAKKAEYNSRNEQLQGNIRALQAKETNSSPLSMLVNPASFIKAIDNSSTTKTLMNNKTANAKGVAKAKAELETSQSELEAKESKLESNKKEVQSNLKKAKAEEKATIDQIDSLKDKYSDELAQQEEANKAVEKAQAKVLKLQVGTAKRSGEKVVNGNIVKAGTASKSESSSSSNSSSNASSGVATGNILKTAAQYLGVPYVWGGTTPSGFDCSGFVQYVFRKEGISLPRTSQAQSTVGTYVPLSSAKPGDLVFWGGVGSAWHVGIYAGNGSYIVAPAPGQNVSYGKVAYFAPSFARRVN